jgi:hypothetical protein
MMVVAAIAFQSLKMAAGLSGNNINSNKNHTVVRNVTESVGFYFHICGDEIDPAKTLGTPEDPIIVKQGTEQTVNVPFCGYSIEPNKAMWLLKLNSGGKAPDYMPLPTTTMTKLPSGAVTGNVTKGLAATLDRGFIDVQAAKLDPVTKAVVSATSVKFNVIVHVTKDAEPGMHVFYIFASKPNGYGGNTEIGKTIVVKVS